jgi:hypothetical protein
MFGLVGVIRRCFALTVSTTSRYSSESNRASITYYDDQC